MSDTDCGAICVSRHVMDKFNVIMDETKLDANELMEHFFNLYNCCVKLVQPAKSNVPQNSQGINAMQLGQQQQQHQILPRTYQQPQQQQQSQNPHYMKTEADDYLAVGMSYNNTSSGSVGGDGSDTSRHSSVDDGADVSMGSTQMGHDGTEEDKVQLLQKLRDQASTGTASSSQSGAMYQHYNPYTGAPTMVHTSGLPGMNDLSQSAQKKKKPPKNKLLSSPEEIASFTENGETTDILKSSMCSLCQATFPRFTDLLAHHKQVHNSDTNHPLRCKACGRTQTSEAGLIYHQVYVCKMVERTHQCPVCGLKFQSEGMVLVHKCSGCPRKKYACEFCDHYKTESSSDLEKHMRIHTGDKCYVCKICGFSTAWKKNLKEHMVKHLGLKPYVCDFCGYATADRHNLRTHKMKHYQKGEACEKCGAGECKCMNLQQGVAVKKMKMSDESLGGAGAMLPPTGAEKDLECPYPNCVYRTKIDYMMAIHMQRHQGISQKIKLEEGLEVEDSSIGGGGERGSSNGGSQMGLGLGSVGERGSSNGGSQMGLGLGSVGERGSSNGGSQMGLGVGNAGERSIIGGSSLMGGGGIGERGSSSSGGSSLMSVLTQGKVIQQGPPVQNGSPGSPLVRSATSVTDASQFMRGGRACLSGTSTPVRPSPSPMSSISQHITEPPISINQPVSTPESQAPLEWKTISHPQVSSTPSSVRPTLGPPSHFSPLVEQGETLQSVAGSTSPWTVTSGSSSYSPFTPGPLPPNAAVPTGLLTNRTAVTMSGQNYLARPMPVFPNMPNH